MHRVNRASKRIIEQFWVAMETNDFHLAAQLLSDDYVLEWPQSGERIRGREAFTTVNERYPAAGPWSFAVRTIVAEGDQVVSDVAVTDGRVSARAITFSSLRDGKISRQVEYWPEPFEAAEWRKQWVERA